VGLWIGTGDGMWVMLVYLPDYIMYLYSKRLLFVEVLALYRKKVAKGNIFTGRRLPVQTAFLMDNKLS
jgi:hypothetical protein